MIGIVDYGAGNLRSVELAFAHLGTRFVTSGDPAVLGDCDRLLIPGDGHAGSTMEVLRKTGLAAFLTDYHRAGKWLLGICIGCQIILDGSYEADVPCLGLLPGRCHKLPGGPGLKVPHMGWNNCVPQREHFLFKDVPREASFYFVHSYYTAPAETGDILGLTDHGIDFPSAIGRDKLWAFQFHPEKSGRWGLKLLSNFLEAN
jgi:imidazole glycerol-phosphate synthase subunit HisH